MQVRLLGKIKMASTLQIFQTNHLMCITTVEHLFRPSGTFPSKGKVLPSPSRFLSGH